MSKNNINTPLVGNIFKYSKAKFVEKTLKNKTLHFSLLKDFNDVYENEYRLTYFFASKEARNRMETLERVGLFDGIREHISRYLDAVKVTCFSYLASNNLMWSHYGDQHEGVCYCFDFTNGKPLFTSSLMWGNVTYSSLVPEIRIFQGNTTEGILDMALTDVVLTKSLEWNYEKELRFFLKEDVEFVSFKPRSLRAIIVGRRTPDDQIADITEHIKEFNQDNDLEQDVKLLFAHRVNSRYDLGVHDNKDFRDNSETGAFSVSIPVLEGINSKTISELYESKDV